MLQSYPTHVVQASPSVLYKLQKSLSLWPALGMDFFLSQWFQTPRTVFIVVPEKKDESANRTPFMCSQCNKSNNENGTSNERTERDVAATAEFVRTLFWTSGRITTGSSAAGSLLDGL